MAIVILDQKIVGPVYIQISCVSCLRTAVHGGREDPHLVGPRMLRIVPLVEILAPDEASRVMHNVVNCRYGSHAAIEKPVKPEIAPCALPPHASCGITNLVRASGGSLLNSHSLVLPSQQRSVRGVLATRLVQADHAALSARLTPYRARAMPLWRWRN
jgi:hypothetical protein